MNGRLLLVAALVLCGLAASRASAAEPDPIAGRRVVVGAGSPAVTPCFSCHGLDGAGDASGGFPRLTGQVPFYSYKQLLDYAGNTRPNAVMSPIARQMSERQMVDVASYYAGVRAPYERPSEASAEFLARGRKIAQEGIADSGIQPCGYCHEVEGRGMPPSFPYLAGQYAPYAELQLRLWKDGLRKNDPLGVMRAIAAAMSLDDMRAVSLFYESLRPASDPAAAPP